MIAGFAITTVAVAPLYAAATHRAEQVSQLLFGERMIVFSRQKDGWLSVKCEWDGYEGWVKAGNIKMISEKAYRKKLRAVSCSSKDVILAGDNTMRLSPGSSLLGVNGRKLSWEEHLLYKGKKNYLLHSEFNKERLLAYSRLFIGASYLWGGRNWMGIDCSGLTQVIFKFFNYRLPRDARQQATIGKIVDFLQEAHCGDLAFFDNDEEEITHVGILLQHNSILHATETAGKVVIDAIDNNGIISKSQKTRTHRLRLIRRYFPPAAGER